MAQLPSPRRATTPQQLAERALRRPSSAIWLNHVCVATADFDAALNFYVGTLGLSLRTVETHPVNGTRLRAILTDAEDRDILELLEAAAPAEPVANVGQLGFSLPRRSWLLLRARLDAQDVTYRLADDCLFLEDTDGIQLRVQPLGDC